MSLPTPEGHSAAFPALATARLGTGWYVCDQAGRREPLRADLERWCGEADAVDLALLARAEGPVIDVGCGPGRLVVELARQGRSALGVDVSSAAVRLTTAAGGAAVRRSVFDPVPGEGRWGAALLADGNVGIGGDPVALLRRCRALVRAGRARPGRARGSRRRLHHRPDVAGARERGHPVVRLGARRGRRRRRAGGGCRALGAGHLGRGRDGGSHR